MSRLSKFRIYIIDGGSSDNTIDIIKKYEKSISYWVSEPDAGQTQAINKGFRLATGDICTWINSDDLIFEGALWKVAKYFSEDKELEFNVGKIIIVNPPYYSLCDSSASCRKTPLQTNT